LTLAGPGAGRSKGSTGAGTGVSGPQSIPRPPRWSHAPTLAADRSRYLSDYTNYWRDRTPVAAVVVWPCNGRDISSVRLLAEDRALDRRRRGSLSHPYGIDTGLLPEVMGRGGRQACLRSRTGPAPAWPDVNRGPRRGGHRQRNLTQRRTLCDELWGLIMIRGSTSGAKLVAGLR